MSKIIGTGAPTSTTPGIVGQEYYDKITKKSYICTDADYEPGDRVGEIDGTYVWEESSGASWGGVLKEITVCQELTVNFIDADGIHIYPLTGTAFTPKLGQIYSVKWNGIKYDLPLKENDHGFYLGDGNGFAELPFTFEISKNGGSIVPLTNEGVGPHTFSITTNEVVNPYCNSLVITLDYDNLIEGDSGFEGLSCISYKDIESACIEGKNVVLYSFKTGNGVFPLSCIYYGKALFKCDKPILEKEIIFELSNDGKWYYDTLTRL